MKKLLLILLSLPFFGIAQNAKTKPGNTNRTDTLKVSGVLKITSSSPGAGKIFTSDASGSGFWGVTITEGSYTPTLTNTTNIAASTAYSCYYIQVGDWVHVWGEVDIDATVATTISEMGMSLPIASALGNAFDLAGTASFEDNTNVQIKADVSNGRAMFRFTPQTNTNNKYSFHFSYKYIAP